MIKNTYNLKIENLKIKSCHGLLPHEKVEPQEFVINICVSSIFPHLDAASDTFDNKNCYGNIRRVVYNVFEEKSHNTIETIASKIIDKTFELNLNFYKIEVEIKKTEIFDDCNAGIKVVREKEWREVCLGLGSNVGDRKENILKAYKLLEREGVVINSKSKLIETDPMYVLNQNKFVNSVIKCHTFYSPLELLTKIENIMLEMGRVRIEKNGPRIIDIDILIYEDLVVKEEGLIIPHPKINERAFVLSGLKEVGVEFA